jgi:hypothetical protein
LIACASNHRSSHAKTGCICASLRKLSANILRFEKFWEQLHVNSSFGEDFARPRAVGYVEHQCSGSVGDVNGGFAGQPQTDVILRQHDFAHALPVLRLVLADPEKLCESEICQRRIAGQLDDAVKADGALELLGLRFGALVTPNQSGTNDLVILVKQDGAMHLAGKADGGDGLSGEARGLKRFANRDCRGAPPIARVLLRPARLRAGEIGVLFGARGEDGAVFIED